MPLWGLSKLVSLGLAGLGSTGVGVYFSPLLSEEQTNRVGRVYDSEGLLNNLSVYLEDDERLVQELKSLFSKFKTVFDDIAKKKENQLSVINKNFQKVTQQEEKLEQEYKASEKLVQELEKIFNSLFEANQKKLEFQAALNSFQAYSKLISQANSFMYEWGSSLKKFVCAIENKGEADECENQSKKWLENLSNGQEASSASSDSSGGGTEFSKAALDQLGSSKQSLEAKLKALGSALQKNIIQQLRVMVAETLSDQGKQNYEGKLAFLSKMSTDWNSRLETQIKQSQSTTQQLNSFYDELRNNYQKWERIKVNESIVYKQKSNIQNLLCTRLSHKEDSDCHKEHN